MGGLPPLPVTKEFWIFAAYLAYRRQVQAGGALPTLFFITLCAMLLALCVLSAGGTYVYAHQRGIPLRP
jgi:hypothetical protein